MIHSYITTVNQVADSFVQSVRLTMSQLDLQIKGFGTWEVDQSQQIHKGMTDADQQAEINVTGKCRTNNLDLAGKRQGNEMV